MAAAANPWLTPEEVAERFKVPLATVYAWRYKRTGPARPRSRSAATSGTGSRPSRRGSRNRRPLLVPGDGGGRRAPDATGLDT